MANDYSFLPHLIDEDIYVIKEKDDVSHSEDSKPPVEAVTNAEVGEVEDAPKVEEPQEIYMQPLPTAGNNLKHCIVFVESNEEVLDTVSKTFLENILKAVKRTMDDILLVNVKEASTDQVEALMVEQNHRHVICFGHRKLTQSASVANYKVHSENHKFYLNADRLDAISENKDMKKALWTALQEMFL